MNMIYRGDGPVWTLWTPDRAAIAHHLTEAWVAVWHAKKWLREGDRYKALIWKKAARYQIELARRERLGLYGVYGVHVGNLGR